MRNLPQKDAGSVLYLFPRKQHRQCLARFYPAYRPSSEIGWADCDRLMVCAAVCFNADKVPFLQFSTTRQKHSFPLYKAILYSMTPSQPRKIKILHLIYTLQIGGAELMLYHLCKGLVQTYPERFESTVACIYGTGPLYDKFKDLGITVVNLHGAGKRFYHSIWRIILLIKKVKPDIVHTHLFPPDRYGQIAAFFCGTRCRISTIHSMEPRLTVAERLTIHLIKYLSTGIIAVSSSAKMHYEHHYAINPNKMTVIYNTSGHSVPAHYRRTPQPPQRPFRLVNLDNLKPAKGQHYLIPAVKELMAFDPTILVDIIGDVTGEYAAYVAAEIRKHKLENTISLLGHIINPCVRLPDYHLMISLSLWEGFHMSLVEGMSVGLPIITTPIPPHLELFDGIEHIFVRHDDPSAIAQKAYATLTDYHLYSSLSQANFRRSAVFSCDTMVAKYAEFYNGCMASRTSTVGKRMHTTENS
ncbi:MAG: glycosyltransferase [Chitinispirillaceae bacterium]|nr:glycosyltransferase [Chitinispirillaceae bacterium]